MLIEFTTPANQQQQQRFLVFNPDAYLIRRIILFPWHNFTGHKIGINITTNTKAKGKSISKRSQATIQKQGFSRATAIGHVQQNIISLKTLQGIVFNYR